MKMNRSKIRWIAIVAIAVALAGFAYAAAAYGGAPTNDGTVIGSDLPLPVEPDGGIGDTPIPVEPDGGIGNTPVPAEQVR